MPSVALNLPVEGTVTHSPEGPLLRLSQRLDGHDTFLTGSLDIADTSVSVRILTLDSVTVLRPADSFLPPADGEHWTGRLHLPHGLRQRSVPPDLNAAADQAARSFDGLDEAELRYVLTFLSEATTPAIRRARIEAVVSALPTTTGRNQ
ncbi:MULTISPECIES: YdeI/OmpD-associated family protein [Streptomyces]|uniref:Uncharacterized protein n=1 Tax=Streptomyces mashuensis TaxID=33904 RepID=A0A919ECJ3_9ACTN|nr:YdeI/OmpD-associated family protein [Streptomyces mashuensis]GHF41843.1 hypothetical protein GCM10010218_23610 [Streptomyces mashuensis]